MKIGIIGIGNMGGAIARGLIGSGRVEASQISLSNPHPSKTQSLQADYPGLRVAGSNREAAQEADIVLLCVKPRLVHSVLQEMQLHAGQILISVAAGVSLAELAAEAPGPIFRVIPNTAISERESMNLICSLHASVAEKEIVLRLFQSLGRCMQLEEAQLAAATSLCSCGMAFIMKYAQAAMQAGIELGLRPAEAQALLAQSFRGAGSLLQNDRRHPATELEKVCSPGGISIRGVNELEAAGFPAAVIRAHRAAH